MTFYKDFEKLVKQETDNLVSFEDSKYKPLQDQLQTCLNLLDFEMNEEKNNKTQEIFNEFENLWQNYREKFHKNGKILSEIEESSNKKHNLDNSSNINSCASAIDRTNGASSPVSNISSVNNSSFSFNWGIKTDVEQLKKDFIKLNEENKYLIKRIGVNNSSISNLKWEICPNYLAIIENLTKEKEKLESDLTFQLSQESMKLEECEAELKLVEGKYENQKKELLDKIENESKLNNQVFELTQKYKELDSHTKFVLENKDGYEALGNTVSDLSLALIGKNEKDLSHKQIQLIKNLFSDSQIKAVNSYKQRVAVIEEEKSQIIRKWKSLTEQNKQIIKPFKTYTLAVKEWIDIYNFLDVGNSTFSDPESLSHLNKHALSFLSQYEDHVNETLPMLNTFVNNLKENMEEISRYSDPLELMNYSMQNDKSLHNMHSSKKFDYQELNISGNMCSPDLNFIDFMSNRGNSTILEITPGKEINLSKDDQFSLFQAWQWKDREIEILKRNLNDNKTAKKTKKKGTKKKGKTNAQEKRQKIIEETMKELDRFNEDEDVSPFEVCPQASGKKLAQFETNTIKEVDERDEEDTQFDKDGNKIPWLNKSLQSSQNKAKNFLNEINYFSADSQKIDISEISKITQLAKTQELNFENIIGENGLSEESESVKIEEDLLNGSFKFDDNIF